MAARRTRASRHGRRRLDVRRHVGRYGGSSPPAVTIPQPHGQTPRQKPPKSRAGNRDVILATDTVAVLTAYKGRRATWRPAASTEWPDTGLFFVRPDGRAWHPNSVSQRFRHLIARAGLLPVRHSATTLSRDTYQSVVKRLHHEAAGAVAEKIKAKRLKSAKFLPNRP